MIQRLFDMDATHVRYEIYFNLSLCADLHCQLYQAVSCTTKTTVPAQAGVIATNDEQGDVVVAQ